MIKLDEIVKLLDSEFSFFKGEDDSCNGLQFEGLTDIGKVAVACDAALETIQKASAAKADLLFVHHGLFWKKALPDSITGNWKKRLDALCKSNLSLYAVHLPLDAHPMLGNNAEMARLLGLKNLQPACAYHGTAIGFRGTKKTTLDALVAEAREKFGATEVFAFGKSKFENIAVGSGGCGFAASNAMEEGFDTLITGEFTHAAYHYAKESGCNVIVCGHYNTEVLGIKAVARWLEQQKGVQTVFIEAPTGL